MLLADYRAYLDCDAEVDACYRRPAVWFSSAILNTARMGYFSSDRTVAEYAHKIWGVLPTEY
jgi:starch phosphorylase